MGKITSWNNRVLHTLIGGILLLRLVLWTLFNLGIKSNKYVGDVSLNSLSFLNQRLDLRDCKSNSWSNFSHEVPLNGPVIARQALFWINPSFSWKGEL